MAKEGKELFKLDDQIKEANLSSFLFGNKTEVLEKIGKETSAFQHKHRLDDESDDEEKEGEKHEVLKPAWEDEDDLGELDLANSKHKKYKVALSEKKISGVELSERLRGTMKTLLKGESDWASLEKKVEEGVLSGITELRGTSKVLAPTFITTIRLNDVNANSPQKGVQCVNFNSTGELLLSTGNDKTVKLFRVDGEKNKLIQSIKVQEMVLHYSHFGPDNSFAVICGASSFFCIFDFSQRKIRHITLPASIVLRSCLSPSGEFLGVHAKNATFFLVSMKTKRMREKIQFPEKEISFFTFSPDSKKIYFTGLNGSIFIYNVETRRFEFKFRDEGSSLTTCLAVSPNGEYFVTGLDSGHVNIYSFESCHTVSAPKPLATLDTIRTKITTLLFNHDSQLLLVASNSVPGALRLVHIPKFSIYENFPPPGPTRKITCAAFSPSSGFLVCGTGISAEMYRLPHFSNA